MVFFRRIHCHFCGAGSPHSRSSGIQQFRCARCEAVNFLDERGNIEDTPAGALVEPLEQRRPLVLQASNAPRQKSQHEQAQPRFCNTCQLNQQIYVEVLSNYLPDDGHPDYRKYEQKLPEFKAKLEQRYPQICARCAPKAQEIINHADYNAGVHNLGKLCAGTPARRVVSDDWKKRSMRWLLNIAASMVYASLFLQATWHLQAIMRVTSGHLEQDESGGQATALDSSLLDCSRQLLQMRIGNFCYRRFMPSSLIISLCLLWYNPGLREWYHPRHRLESVDGQREHLVLQAILLAARTVAYFRLSDPEFSATLNAQQLLAAHGFLLAFAAVVQWMSSRTIRAVPWRLKPMTPAKRSELIGLKNLAKIGDMDYTPAVSSLPPSQLLARERMTSFPIATLASQSGSSMNTSTGAAPPSPPDSMSDTDEVHAMEMDWQPSLQSRVSDAKSDRTYQPHLAETIRNYGITQPTGWAAVRDEAFRIQTEVQAETERKQRAAEERAKLRFNPPVEQSPFRGRLPQAPMSVERKLRNPPTQVSFKKTTPSKQQSFMAQMRGGLNIGEQSGAITRRKREMTEQHADVGTADGDLSPDKIRSRNHIELKEATWVLPTDVPQATGLEEIFGGSNFKIVDEVQLPTPLAGNPAASTEGYSVVATAVFAMAVLVGLLAVAGWCITDVRRAVCLWLVTKLAALG